jgi:hypothetical protein
MEIIQEEHPNHYNTEVEIKYEESKFLIQLNLSKSNLLGTALVFGMDRCSIYTG